MIVLDTNVISELVRGPGSAPQVRTWLRGLDEQPVTTVLNRAELLAGVAFLPDGHRKNALEGAVERLLASLTICLPFTVECSVSYAGIQAVRSSAGRPISTMDALIAAVARVHGAAIATRDVTGFEGLGLRIVDPWSPDA